MAASVRNCALHPIAYPISSHLILSHLILSHLISSHLTSSHLISPAYYLSPSQLFAAHISSRLFSRLLSSSQLFSHLLSWSQFFSPGTSSQLFKAHWPEACSKTGSRRQSHKKYDFEAFLKANTEGNIKRQTEKIIDNSSPRLWRNHSNAICKQQVAKDHGTTCGTATQSNVDAATNLRLANTELQKTMEIRAQQQHGATMTQPPQRDLQAARCRRP